MVRPVLWTNQGARTLRARGTSGHTDVGMPGARGRRLRSSKERRRTAFVLEVEHDPVAPEVEAAGRAQVRPGVDPPHRAREREFALGVDRDHLEAPVVQARHRRDVHPAAEVPAVADRDHERVDPPLVARAGQVDRAAHPAALALGQGARARPQVGRLASERLRRLRDVTVDEAPHPGRQDVDEPPPRASSRREAR